MPRPTNPSNRLLRALMHYVAWHEHLLLVADEVVRVEDTDAVAMCQGLGGLFAERCPSPDGVQPEEDGDDVGVDRVTRLRQEWAALVAHYSAKQAFPKTSWAELVRLSPGSYLRSSLP